MNEIENDGQISTNEQKPAGENTGDNLADLPVTTEQETQVTAGGPHVRVFDGLTTATPGN